MSKPYPADVLDQIKAAIASWQAIDPTLKFGDLSLEMMQSVLEQGQTLRNRIEALEIQLTDLRDQRDAIYHTGWKYINRLRDGIYGHYGDNSSEYEMVGRLGSANADRAGSGSSPRSRSPLPGQSEASDFYNRFPPQFERDLLIKNLSNSSRISSVFSGMIPPSWRFGPRASRVPAGHRSRPAGRKAKVPGQF